MSDPRDYKLDIPGVDPARANSSDTSSSRPFLSVLFACCSVYQRVYRNDDGTEYAGRCPKCGKFVRFPIGPGGTTARTFVVE
jgi:hypothetical protein